MRIHTGTRGGVLGIPINCLEILSKDVLDYERGLIEVKKEYAG